MPSTERKLELKAKTSMAHTASQAAVYAKGLIWIGGSFHDSRCCSLLIIVDTFSVLPQLCDRNIGISWQLTFMEFWRFDKNSVWLWRYKA
jgi:hypothetical protein